MAAGLPVEGSWRMVEGEHDSFDTSVVPNDEDDPFLSSGQPSQDSSAGGDMRGPGLGISMSSSSGGGSGNSSRIASQDADIDAFLRRAEDDEPVLRLSPFHPSLPSSVRQSPPSPGRSGSGSSRLGYPTPEPEFRMPTVEVESRPPPLALALADGHVHRRPGCHVSETGSPAQRCRRAGGAVTMGQVEATTTAATAATTPPSEPPSRHHLLSSRALLAGLGVVLAACSALAAGLATKTTMPMDATLAVLPACSLPGVAWLDLAACASPSPSPSPSPSVLPPSDAARDEANATSPEEADDYDVGGRWHSLSQSAAELMRTETRLAIVVRDRVVPGGGGSSSSSSSSGSDEDAAAMAPSAAQDAWLVPRARTKDLRLQLQIQQSRRGRSAAAAAAAATAAAATAAAAATTATVADTLPHPGLRLAELDDYLEASKRVSMALTRFQTGGGAATPDTLAHSTRRMLAQLRRMAKDGGGNGATAAAPWLGWGAAATPSPLSPRLRDVYGRYAAALAAKAGERVADATAVLAALDAAGARLDVVQGYVVAQRDALGEEEEGGGQNQEEQQERQQEGQEGQQQQPPLLWRLLRALFPVRWPSPAKTAAADRIAKALRQWDGYAAQLAAVRELHDDVARRTTAAQVELAAVQRALQRLQHRFGGGDGEGDGSTQGTQWDTDAVDMRLHLDIVEAGLQDLARLR